MIPTTMANESPEAGQPQQLPFEDLPSYGMSKFMDMGNGQAVQKFLRELQTREKAQVLASTSTCMLTGQNEITITTSTNGQSGAEGMTDEAIVNTVTQICAQEEAGLEVTVETTQGEDEEGEVIIYQNDYPLFTAGGTQPLQTSTVDGAQIGIGQLQGEVSDEALFGEGVDAIMLEPQTLPSLEVKTTGYSRFRYQSERNSANKRPRQYEMDEEKRCLAEIKMNGYSGTAKVIVYCVDSQGVLHPYQLFGSDCHHGVFVKRMDFSRKNSILKLLKVSVTTPKAKEYQNSILEQRQYLEEFNVITEKEVPEKVTDIRDKQVVYLMVKVLLEDGQGTMVCHITKEIRNKKEGTEFCIRTVVPSCAPVRGPSEVNLDKTKVCVIVTDNTAFPKDVCVVLRKTLDDGQQWMRVLKVPQIEVIRKAVVEFTPPPFRDPTLSRDVEVQLSLRDLKTGQETDPATFTYKGTDEYGVQEKGKKRKLLDYEMSLPEGYQQAESQTLHAVRKKTFVGKDGYAMNASVAMPPATSVTVVPSQSNTVSSATLSQPPTEEPEISIGGMRRTKNAVRQQLPDRVTATATSTTQMVTSSSYLSPPSTRAVGQQSAMTGMKQEVMTPVVSASPAPVSTLPQTARPVPAQPPAEPAPLDAPVVFNQLATVIQAIAKKENKSPDQVSPEEIMQALRKAYNKQVSGQGAPSTSMPSVNTAVPQPVTPMQPIINPQVSSQFPKLKPNQMLAVINGQIVILNDDTNDAPQVPEAPAASGGMVQDIGGQQVHVQKMPIQHPSSDMAAGQAGTSQPSSAGLQHGNNGGLQFQLTHGYIQQSPAVYGYQQAPTSTPMASTSHHQPAQKPPSQQQQNSETFTPQFSPGDTGTGFGWHNINTNLDDNDLEIDSGAPASNQTDDDKNDQRANSVDTDTLHKVMDVAGEEEEDGGFQNLPKIIGDASEESEGEEKRNDTDGEEGVLDTSSEEDSDDMQS